MSASCYVVEMGSKWMRASFNFSPTIWHYISICFVRSWNTEFAAMHLAESLSQSKEMVVQKELLNLEEDRLVIEFYM